MSMHQNVSDFYYERTQTVKSEGSSACAPNLSTISCKPVSCMPQHMKNAFAELHEDVKSKYFGCGLPFPEDVAGAKVLDLGCGVGRDCFVLSKLVGPDGKVVGVDMTTEILDQANSFVDFHSKQFGYSNVEFKHGFLETLDKIGLENQYFDLVISNCVICLCMDKVAVFKHAYDLLKPGGELYFSDIYASDKVVDAVKENNRAYNEGFGGSLVWSDFEQISRDIGFLGPFVTDQYDYETKDPDVEKLLDGVKFWSKTVRLIKPKTQTNGQQETNLVTYKGTMLGCPEKFNFSKDFQFLTNVPMEVSKEMIGALRSSRYVNHFDLK